MILHFLLYLKRTKIIEDDSDIILSIKRDRTHQKKASSSKRAKFEEKLEKLAAESKEDRIMLKELC